MHLYNTLSRSIEEFTPIKPPHVGLYACGPTVYDSAHIGHMRKYTMDDVLVRLLRHEGFKVKFVQNITDVGHLASDADTGEDKLEKGAKKYGESVWEIAKRFEADFWQSMDAMGNLRPDVSCRATEHIEQQLQMVIELEKKGFTYIIDGDGVYFDTSKLADYGKLAGWTTEKLANFQKLARVEDAGKENATDFALWKFERAGESRAMSWPSPWAERSFPGWHIECSAMAIEYLGEQFDIHTGGIDHIDIHHTNEIAQAESASGKQPFVKYWVHHNFLRVDGEKMSKSLGNFYTIKDVKEKGYSPMALRLLFLGAHYHNELNFTWKNFAGSQKAWTRLQKMVKSWQRVVDQHEEPLARHAEDVTIDRHAELTSDSEVTLNSFQGLVGNNDSQSSASSTDISHAELVSASSKQNSKKTLSATANSLNTRFWSALLDDLNTPQAVATLWDMTKSDLPDQEKIALWRDWNTVLGLQIDSSSTESSPNTNSDQPLDPTTLPQELQDLIKKRQETRERKDWQEADRLREEIETHRLKIQDVGGKAVIWKKN